MQRDSERDKIRELAYPHVGEFLYIDAEVREHSGADDDAKADPLALHVVSLVVVSHGGTHEVRNSLHSRRPKDSAGTEAVLSLLIDLRRPSVKLDLLRERVGH